MSKVRRKPFFISRQTIAIIETYTHRPELDDEFNFLWVDNNVDDTIDYTNEARELIKHLLKHECRRFIRALRDACNEILGESHTVPPTVIPTGQPVETIYVPFRPFEWSLRSTSAGIPNHTVSPYV